MLTKFDAPFISDHLVHGVPRYIRDVEYTILDHTTTQTLIKYVAAPPFTCAGEITEGRSVSLVCKVGFTECFKRKTVVRRLQVGNPCCEPQHSNPCSRETIAGY